MKKHEPAPVQSRIIGGLLFRVDTFLSQTGMSETLLGRKVMNDTSLIHRIRRGGDVYTGTVDAIDDFMNEYLRDHQPLLAQVMENPPKRNGRGRRIPQRSMRMAV